MRRRTAVILAQSRVLKGALAGAVGGLAGAGVMSLFSRLVANTIRRHGSVRGDLPRLEARRFVSGSAEELDFIGAAADWIDAHLLGHKASPRRKSLIAAGVHYAAGAGLGVIYGASVEIAPVLTSGWGVPFAVAESIVMESGMASALAWGGSRGYTFGDHVQSALEHGAYGITLELVRRSARKAA